MIKVRVPGTSANMGPGFDSIGIAVNIYNDFGFKEIEEGLKFVGVPEEFANKNNVVYEGMKLCFERGKYTPKGIEITVLKQDIPIARGLGSSSSCIVAGLVGANAIMNNKFSKDEILQMAVEIEGHPDNVAPAVLGSMVVAIMEEGKVYYDLVKGQKGIKYVPIIPDFRLSTKEARSVLPKEIPLKDGVYNVGRASLMVTAMANGNYNLLRYACRDAFHENYRSSLINGFNKVKEKSNDLGAYATYLSGAGPTIMAMVPEENISFVEDIKRFLIEEGLNWKVHNLSMDSTGAEIFEGDI